VLKNVLIPVKERLAILGCPGDFGLLGLGVREVLLSGFISISNSEKPRVTSYSH